MKKTGQLLKEAREAKGISLQEVSIHLKISTRTLKSLEDGDKNQLPAKTFLRGFVQSYAQFLKINLNDIMIVFQEEMGTTHPGMVTTQIATPPANYATQKPQDNAGLTPTQNNNVSNTNSESNGAMTPPESKEKSSRKSATSTQVNRTVKTKDPVPPVVSVDPKTWTHTLRFGTVLFVVLILSLIFSVKKTIDKYVKEATLPASHETVLNNTLPIPSPEAVAANQALTQNPAQEIPQSTDIPTTFDSSGATVPVVAHAQPSLLPEPETASQNLDPSMGSAPSVATNSPGALSSPDQIVAQEKIDSNLQTAPNSQTASMVPAIAETPSQVEPPMANELPLISGLPTSAGTLDKSVSAVGLAHPIPTFMYPLSPTADTGATSLPSPMAFDAVGILHAFKYEKIVPISTAKQKRDLAEEHSQPMTPVSQISPDLPPQGSQQAPIHENPPSAMPEVPDDVKTQEVIIEALERVTVEFSIDGGPKETFVLNREKIHTFKARQVIQLKVSDGGSINLFYNGKDKGIPGQLNKEYSASFSK